MTAPRRSRVLAYLLVVLTFLGTSGTWHVSPGDADCFDTALDAGSARLTDSRGTGLEVRAVSETASPEHCAICHWLQSFRSSSPRDGGVHRPAVAVNVSSAPAASHPRAVTLLNLPSRAPPA